MTTKPFRSIRWRITLAYLVVLASIVGSGFYLSRWTEHYYVSSLHNALLTECRFVGSLGEQLMPSGPGAVGPLVRQAGRELGRRVTIIAPDGRVLGDSSRDYATMDLHDRRPEVRQALAAGSGSAIRYSPTLRIRMLYVATRIGSQDHPLGVARLAEDLSVVDQARGIIHRVFFIAALTVFTIALLVGGMISRNVSRPIMEMSRAARQFARGDLDWKLEAPSQPGNEIDELAITLNRMVSELRGSMDDLTAERVKLEAILDKVDDGIAVVDASGRMQMVNPAASRLLDARSAEGKTVIEATLSHQISGLVNRVLRTGDPESLEVRLQTSNRAQADLYAAPLESPDGSPGALIVVHDLSAARRIDSVRRDFVANVSHELRTPLASIRAMAETIVLRGKGDEKIAGDFAGKIIAEADRLTAISEDLLDLAQIESGRRAVRRNEFRISELIDQVMQQLRPPAEQRSDELSADVPEDLIFHGDREALREILANLVDNAVRHTPPGTKVTVSAGLESDRLSIAVADTGEGIAAAELPRIFERFYRVDKARSRESGGTGLGLSIVKHLCELMGGTVSVRSEIGEGTTFTVSLPFDA